MDSFKEKTVSVQAKEAVTYIFFTDFDDAFRNLGKGMFSWSERKEGRVEGTCTDNV